MPSFKLAFLTLLLIHGHAQTVPTLAFDVVSIKPGIPDDPHAVVGVFPTSYRAKGLPLLFTLQRAFLQFGERTDDLIRAAPAWVQDQPFDIEAKFDEPTAAAFQHMNSNARSEAIRPLLIELLKDRFKLTFHTQAATIDGYALVLGKHGPHLTPATPGFSPTPETVPLSEGGYMIPIRNLQKPELTFFDTSLSALAAEFKSLGTLVVDRTGLPGRYDFTLPRLDLRSPDFSAENDPGQRLPEFDVTPLGLELKPTRLPAQAIVIDHVDRPFPN